MASPPPWIFASGIVEASIAPLFMVLGFYAWDHHWNGSPFALNMFKCNVAAIGFVVVLIIVGRSGAFTGPQSDDNGSVVTIRSIAMLMLSSILGVVMGDLCWLESMRILSARKIILVDCLKPFLAAYVGWAWFDEQLGIAAFAGLVLTCGGVLIVELDQTDQDNPGRTDEAPASETKEVVTNDASEMHELLDQSRSSSSHLPSQQSQSESSYAQQRENQQHRTTSSTLIYGYAVSYLNVILHTCGATLTKMYGTGMNTWLICLIRFGFAGIVLGMVSTVFSVSDCLATKGKSISSAMMPSISSSSPSISDISRSTPWYRLPRMSVRWWIYVLAGVACCTFVFPALINDAIFKIPLALLLTLESIGPLYSLPVSWMVQKEVPTLKSCAGALLAFVGVAILSLKGMATGHSTSV